MALHVLDETIWFPPVEESLPDGLLAMGGDVSPERLLHAYTNGIFPWYEGEIPLWWSPDPRFVLFPKDLKVSKSMKQVINSRVFTFTYNTSFEKVINHCKTIKRNEQDGTWLTEPLIESLIQLHKKGIAVSAETWYQNKLVGGLYGILVNNVFVVKVCLVFNQMLVSFHL
jgi:leucyl/phenylalanyl-tRNA--protein transferase